MPHDKLSYKNLNHTLLNKAGASITYNVNEHSYYCCQGKGGVLGSPVFFFIGDMSGYSDKVAKTENGEKFETGKLKFHVSLPEDDREKFAQGFNLVKDILIDHHIQTFKVVHDQERMSGGVGDQRSKDITFYGDGNPEKTLEDWQEIIQQITEALVAANISPGYATVKADTGYIGVTLI